MNASWLPAGITVVEPLWGCDTKAVAEEFFASGLRTVVVTTNAALLDERFVGREYDRDFVAELPEGVDPCGENGEFHTFCYAGGMFRIPVEFSLGKPLRPRLFGQTGGRNRAETRLLFRKSQSAGSSLRSKQPVALLSADVLKEKGISA